MSLSEPSMANSAMQDDQATAPAPDTGETHRGSYPMSREGRRQAIVLALGVVSIWVFALWTLITILQGGVSGVEWVSGLLMLGILVVAPLVGWALLEEASCRITLDGEGLRYRTLAGIDLAFDWDEISLPGPRRPNRLARFFLGDEPTAELARQDEGNEPTIDAEPRELSVPDPTARIANPVTRLLHRLAHGTSIPLYEGLENRDELIKSVMSHQKLKDD